jgi:hypothetical protein
MELMALLEAEANAKSLRSSRQREAVVVSNPAVVASTTSPQVAPSVQETSQVPKAKSSPKKKTAAVPQREKAAQQRQRRPQKAAKPMEVACTPKSDAAPLDEKDLKEDHFSAILDAVAKSNALNADRARARSIRSLSTTSGVSSPSHITSPASVIEAETDAESRLVGSTTRSDNSGSIGAPSGQSNCESAEICSESANEPGDWSSQSPSIGDMAESSEVAESVVGDGVMWAQNVDHVSDTLPDTSKTQFIETDCLSSPPVVDKAARCAASKWLEDALCGPSRRQNELQRLADMHQNYEARTFLPVPPPPPLPPPDGGNESTQKDGVGLAEELRAMFPKANIHIFPSAAEASPRSKPPQTELVGAEAIMALRQEPLKAAPEVLSAPVASIVSPEALFQLPAASLGPPPSSAPSVAEVEALNKASSWRDRLRKNGEQHLGEVEAALGRRQFPLVHEISLLDHVDLPTTMQQAFNAFDGMECTQVEAALGCHQGALDGGLPSHEHACDLPLSFGTLGPLDVQMPMPHGQLWHADSGALYTPGMEVDSTQLWQASPLDGAMWHAQTSLFQGASAYSSDPHAFIEAMPMDASLHSDQLVAQLQMGIPMDGILEREPCISAQLPSTVPAMDNFDREQIAAQLRAAAPCHYED